jgi:hypothetical protein
MVREGRLAIDPEDSVVKLAGGAQGRKAGVGAWRAGRRRSVLVDQQSAAMRTEIRVGECFGEIVLLGTTCRQVESPPTPSGSGCSSL